MVVVQWRALSSSSSSRQPIIRRKAPRELQLHQVGANPLRTRYDLSVRPSVANKREKTLKPARRHRAGAGNRQKSAFARVLGLARRPSAVWGLSHLSAWGSIYWGIHWSQVSRFSFSSAGSYSVCWNRLYLQFLWTIITRRRCHSIAGLLLHGFCRSMTTH